MDKRVSNKLANKLGKDKGDIKGLGMTFKNAELDIAVCSVNTVEGRRIWKALHNSPKRYYIYEKKQYVTMKTEDVMFVITYYKNLDTVRSEDEPGFETKFSPDSD